MTKTAILVSPAPVDGYPPVQHQARLLVDAGFVVELITVPLAWTSQVRFAQAGVRVHGLTTRPGKVGALRRAADFMAKLFACRRRAGCRAVEIAYEPIGILYSDLVPLRPTCRIAHFHECLQRFETSRIERRLQSAIRGFQIVIVPDTERAATLRNQLAMTRDPLTVPNYPMVEQTAPQGDGTNKRFEVVYCGSIGLQQKLDLIVESVPLWPEDTALCIIGNTDCIAGRQIARTVAKLDLSDRIHFAGWTPYDEVPARLAACSLGISFLDPTFEQWRTALGASNKRYHYMQAGLPQIGDMNPGVPALIEGNGIGRCVTEFSARQIADIVAHYAQNPRLCKTEGARSYQLHLERFNYQKAFAPILDWIATAQSEPTTAAA